MDGGALGSTEGWSKDLSQPVKCDFARSRSQIALGTLAPMSSTLARNIRDVLNERGIKPHPASVAAGLGPTFVRDILTGRTKSPRMESLIALAESLDVPLERLTGGALLPGRRLPPGKGVADWAGFLQLLVSKKYAGYLSYEAPNPANWSRSAAEVAREGADAMRAQIARATAA